MYETLTAFVTPLENSQVGKWVVDTKSDGSPEHPIQLPYVDYEKETTDFINAVYTFADEHKEMDIYNYNGILASHNIRWGQSPIKEVNVEKLDGQAVVALIMGAVRAERFCDGMLLEFFQKGCIAKWLNRLKELDEEIC